jgi:hypothetical protein
MSDALAVHTIIQAIGWALLYSLWQGAVIGVATAVALRALRHSRANARYVAACAGLLAMALVFAGTVVLSARDAHHAHAARPSGVLAWSEDAQPVRDPMAVETTHGADGTTRLPGAIAIAATGTDGRDSRGLRERLHSWAVSLVPLWLLGVGVLSLRLLTGCLLIERLRRTGIRPLPEPWTARVEAIARRLRLRQPVAVFESALVSVPTLLGWLRPVVLLPPSAFAGLSVAQLEAIIAHELAHVRRHDYLVNFLQTAIEIVLFYHPAMWWISRQIRLERENCCDDVAVAQCGDRVVYARALADLEGLRHAAVGLAATGGSLTSRVHRLLGIAAAPRASTSQWIVVATIVALPALMLTGGSLGGASTPALLAQSPVPTPGRAIPGDEGIVQGRVMDARTGRPLAGAVVEIVADARAERSLPSGRVYRGRAAADGRFEITAVAPGEYVIGATAPKYVLGYFGSVASHVRGASVRVAGGAIVSGIEIELQPEAVVHGRILTDAGEGMSGVEVELLRDTYFPGGARPAAVAFAQSEEHGLFRIPDVPPGEYYLRAYVPESVRPAGANSSGAYLSTYFPAATDLAAAQRIVLHGGEELFGFDFALAIGRTYTLSGRLVDSDGPPLDTASVVLSSPTQRADGSRLQANVASDGRFELRDLAPGEYWLMVTDPGRYQRWLGATRVVSLDDDVSDLEIVAERGASFEGRFVSAGGGPLPFDPTGIRVMIERPMPGQATLMWSGIGAGRGGVQRDGTFWIEGFPGSLSLQISELPRGWTVGSILLDGADVTDAPIEVAPGRSGRLEVVLTDRVSAVSGLVTDRRARPVAGSIVVAFPEQSSRWEAARRIRTAFSGQDGRFQIDDLPSGDYRAIAVASLPTNAWRDPDVLGRLWWSATAVRLLEGERRVVDLGLTPTPEGLRLR